MEISLGTIQELAPDQASLTAAKKLLKPAKWPVLGQSSANNTIWGECQGSGSKPYYTVADVCDHGYKCTCPSRKFPCKHVLALLWQFSDTPTSFSETDAPQWVIEWLGRTKRTTTTAANKENPSQTDKNINALDVSSTPISAEDLAKKQAAQAKRTASNKAKTDTAINDGLLEFQQWLDDQLVNGISEFIKEIKDRCRRIAARLVDAKATNMAARIDEFPAKILPLPAHLQPDAVYQELGKLALLSEAWFTNCDDVDVRRAIISAETREQVLSDPQSLKVNGLWQTVGERIETRRNGLIAHSKWLVNLNGESPQPALLLDFYPASSGYKRQVESIGRIIEGDVIFYPAKLPMRALLGQFKVVDDDSIVSSNKETNSLQHLQHQLTTYPWIEQMPAMLGQGKVFQDKQNRFWWSSHNNSLTFALTNQQINPIIPGSALDAAFIVSNGNEAELLSAKTKNWGVIAC